MMPLKEFDSELKRAFAASKKLEAVLLSAPLIDSSRQLQMASKNIKKEISILSSKPRGDSSEGGTVLTLSRIGVLKKITGIAEKLIRKVKVIT